MYDTDSSLLKSFKDRLNRIYEEARELREMFSQYGHSVSEIKPDTQAIACLDKMPREKFANFSFVKEIIGIGWAKLDHSGRVDFLHKVLDKGAAFFEGSYYHLSVLQPVIRTIQDNLTLKVVEDHGYLPVLSRASKLNEVSIQCLPEEWREKLKGDVSSTEDTSFVNGA